MLKKLFPFLFKKKSTPDQKKSATKPNGNTARGSSTTTREPVASNYFGLIARNKNHRGLRKGSKVYVRQLFEDGDRLRVRGTAPNGKKVTLSIHRKSLKDFESEAIPEHLEKHYREDSIFKDEHEAKVKAEALGKY